MSYRNLLERLEKYEPKELTDSAFIRYDEDDSWRCCAIGAILGLQPHGPCRSITVELVGTGLATHDEIASVIRENDRFEGSPAGRYQNMLTVLWEAAERQELQAANAEYAVGPEV